VAIKQWLIKKSICQPKYVLAVVYLLLGVNAGRKIGIQSSIAHSAVVVQNTA